MLRPFGQRLIIKAVVVEEVQKGILLPDSAKKQKKEFVVIEVHEDSSLDIGDKVIIRDYSQTNFECPDTGVDLAVVREEDVLAVF